MLGFQHRNFGGDTSIRTLEFHYHNLLHFSLFIILLSGKIPPSLCPALHLCRACIRELSDAGENAYHADWYAFQCTATNLLEPLGMTGNAPLTSLVHLLFYSSRQLFHTF